MPWLLLTLFTFISINGLAQSLSKDSIDNSKPTNVYSQIDNYLEFTHTPAGNLMGYHPKINYAPNDKHLALIEIPFLYNDLTQKTGIRDLRLKYFYVPYKNYNKTLGALGLSIDAYVPIGNVENGLGTGSWVFTPGIMLGLIANKTATLSFFPTLAYTFQSKSISDNYGSKHSINGLNFQTLASYKINSKSFILITPIWEITKSSQIGSVANTETKLEIEFVHDILKGKNQIGAMTRTSFTQNIQIFRLNFTIFL